MKQIRFFVIIMILNICCCYSKEIRINQPGDFKFNDYIYSEHKITSERIDDMIIPSFSLTFQKKTDDIIKYFKFRITYYYGQDYFFSDTAFYTWSENSPELSELNKKGIILIQKTLPAMKREALNKRTDVFSYTVPDGEDLHWQYFEIILLHSDHLGSAQVVTNYQGRIHERLEYTPYGELWIDWRSGETPEDSTPFRFTGKEVDPETGLYYYGARYLDPKTSRWISGDPALGEYIPSAPVNDEARKRNQNLPGQGGVFNDPDGEQAGPPITQQPNNLPPTNTPYYKESAYQGIVNRHAQTEAVANAIDNCLHKAVKG